MSDVDLVCVFSIRRSRARNYDAELRGCRPEATLVEFGDYHPLKPIMVGSIPAHAASVQCVLSLSVCIMFWFPPECHWPLRSGDGHKNPPRGSQGQHFLIFLLLIVCSNGSSQLNAGWDGSPLHVRRIIGCWGSDHVTQCLCWGSFTPLILRLTSRRTHKTACSTLGKSSHWSTCFCVSGRREKEER